MAHLTYLFDRSKKPVVIISMDPYEEMPAFPVSLILPLLELPGRSIDAPWWNKSLTPSALRLGQALVRKCTAAGIVIAQMLELCETLCPVMPGISAVVDRGDRLVHRLLVHLRYLYLHLDRSFCTAKVGSYIHVSSELRGVMPFLDDDDFISGIGYVLWTPPNRRQRPTFVPLYFTKHSHQELGVASMPHVSGKRMLLTGHGRVLEDSGLVLNNLSAGTANMPLPPNGADLDPMLLSYDINIVAYQGLHPDGLGASFHTSDSHVSAAPERVALLEPEDQRKVERKFNLANHLRVIMGDDFPMTNAQKLLPLPQHPIEKAAAELLILEELVELARDHANAPAQLMLQHIEAGTGQSIEKVLRDARANMERMIAEAMAAHTEITRRAELRTAQLQSLKVGLSASSPAVSSSALAPRSGPGSSNATADSPAAAASYLPQWIRACENLESLRSAASIKYRHAKAIALSVLNSPLLRLESVSKTGGSHRVYHFADGQAPLTLVRHHGSNDSLISRQGATRIYEQLMQVAMAAVNKTISE